MNQKPWLAVLTTVLALIQRVSCSTLSTDTFDFVVVGGGSSGSIVAGRLAHAGHRVLLMEAGGLTQHSLMGDKLTVHPNLTLFDVPLYWTDITANPLYAAEYEWPLYASPHPQIARGLGGCSVHNAMIYIRGLDRDFDDWGSDWHYETVMDFYRRSVTQQDPALRQSPLHSPVVVNDREWLSPIHLSSVHPSDRDPIATQFIGACKSSGMNVLADFNGPHRRDGAGYYQFLIREGERETPASSMYGVNGIVDNGKLTVLTYSQAVKLIVDNSTSGGRPRVTGVEYVSLPQSPVSSLTSSQAVLSSLPRQRVYAKREVIVSAGTINTPKLLLLSGIGDCDRLRARGVNECHSDLKGVGSNAMDGSKVIMQWAAPSIYFNPCIPSEEIGGKGPVKNEQDAELERKFCEHAFQQFFDAKHELQRVQSNDSEQSSAPMSPPVSYGVMGTPGFSAGAFLKSDPVLERPNIQLTIFPWDKVSSQWRQHHTGVVTMEVATNNPISRGTVELHSSLWFDPPIVNVNYLNESQDVEVLLWAVKKVRTIVDHFPLNETLTTELKPGLSLDDRQLKHYILCGHSDDNQPCEVDQRVLGHLGGTAKMGDYHGDKLAVVDSHLRVYGIDGLRVADASIMPILPSGNTHATCMMIGERAADFILQNVAGTERPCGYADENRGRDSVPGSQSKHSLLGLSWSSWLRILIVCIACAIPATIVYWQRIRRHYAEVADERRPLMQSQPRGHQ